MLLRISLADYYMLCYVVGCALEEADKILVFLSFPAASERTLEERPESSWSFVSLIKRWPREWKRKARFRN